MPDAEIGVLDSAKIIAAGQAEAQSSKSVLDGLLAEAKVLTKARDTWADIQNNDYGWHIVVWDRQPVGAESTWDGHDVTGIEPDAKIVTSGSGRTLLEALQAANRGMAPRS